MPKNNARVVKARRPALSKEEKRRRYVFEIMGQHDWETHVLIDRMAMMCKWLKTGEGARKKPAKPALSVVPDVAP